LSIADHLVWIDLEMTGLDPETCTIIEIATVVTNSRLETVAIGPNIAIHQPDALLDAMDDWNTTHHTASGLVQRVKNSHLSLLEAEDLTLEFLMRHAARGESPLCGNSIGQDRRFLLRYMPRVHDFLHYRNIDVSTLKELVRRWYPSDFQPPAKAGNHLALDDILESIEGAAPLPLGHLCPVPSGLT
jgi:oligoribonuclease